MEKERIVIAGGSGFLGQNLAQYFDERGYEVVVLTRRSPRIENGIRYVRWNARQLGNWTQEVDGARAVINLCGKSVDCRYTDDNKKAIYDSRLDSTRVLGLAMLKANHPPAVWLNAASATVYRHALDRPMTEDDHEVGEGFSVDVCLKWERMFYSFDLPATRQVALRTTIVFGTEDSALQPMTTMARIGLGGHHGEGNQMVSWMHIYDFCRAVGFIMTRPQMEGPINLGAPNPVTNKNLVKKIREVVGMSIGLPSPKWFLEIGALIIRTETELLLKSRWVLPEKLQRAGFRWEFPTIDKAIADLSAHRLFT